MKAVIHLASALLTLSLPAAEGPITVALVGDSTVTATAGWGGAFAERFPGGVTVRNFAVGGRSSKSFLAEKRLSAVLDSKPDYIFIQFGHNDQTFKGPELATDPETTFRENLRVYVKAARDIGAQPILVSSLVRRHFTREGRIGSSLTPWAKATQSVAKEMDVPFIDLHQLSMDYHNRVGPEASLAFAPAENDVAHLSPEGARIIADLILNELPRVAPGLAQQVEPETGE